MKIEDLCFDCAVGTPSKTKLVPVGGSTRDEMHAGNRGYSLDKVQEYKCPNCGATWENLVESGAGGHGNFWTRTDPKELPAGESKTFSFQNSEHKKYLVIKDHVSL